MTTEKKEPSLQIYSVIDTDGKQRLIKVKNKIKAIMHVFDPQAVSLKPTEIVDAMQNGAKVEDAE